MAKYLLIQNYEGGAGCDTPMGAWDPADIRRHIDFQIELDADLTAAGELLDSQGVAAPDQAKWVVSDGGEPSVTTRSPDRPLLAGYRVVDVESEDRALEIAARASAAPGPAGVPIQQPIEVRQVMVAP
jgi:hypothetical protein